MAKTSAALPSTSQTMQLSDAGSYDVAECAATCQPRYHIFSMVHRPAVIPDTYAMGRGSASQRYDGRHV